MDIDPLSTRAQFAEVPTPAELASFKVSKSPYLPSPSVAQMDTPNAPEFIVGDGVAAGSWAAGLFNCFDNLVPNCFMVTFCPCVALAQLSTRLGVAPYRVILSMLVLASTIILTMVLLMCVTATEDYYSIDGAIGHVHDKMAESVFLVLMLLVVVLLLSFISYLRAITRRRFQIPGNSAIDCLSSWFCSCCAVAQLRTHVRVYQPGSCTFGPPNVLPAYPDKSYAV
ncbi:hypothetical protein CCR75_004460 [Bremia lactucae]|uniref:PLAC8 family protein n=1 Tax=Bremia lactucae TaxID=4779 RepID=A0A976NXY2_BRELC|nr:hypothetical protein CCR75_004460 [Bremia lactucae]